MDIKLDNTVNKHYDVEQIEELIEIFKKVMNDLVNEESFYICHAIKSVLADISIDTADRIKPGVMYDFRRKTALYDDFSLYEDVMMFFYSQRPTDKVNNNCEAMHEIDMSKDYSDPWWERDVDPNVRIDFVAKLLVILRKELAIEQAIRKQIDNY